MNLAVWLEGVWQDVRHSGRQLRLSPGFAAVAVASLALGIGATSALFSVVDAVLLKPLPIYEPDRLVQVLETRKGERRGGGPARLKDFQASQTLSGVAGFYGEGVTVRGANGPERMTALRTFGPITRVLGVTPVLGRGFTASEETGIGQPVALITHAVWQKRFGGDRDVLGRTLSLGVASCPIVGILPASIQFPEETEVWIPAPDYFQNLNRTATFLSIVARIAPGATIAQAQSEIQTINASLGAAHPATDKDIDIHLRKLQDYVVEDARTPLLALFGAVAGVLLVACVNIAGLLLARGWSRQRESGIRVALGAGVARLVRLRLIESFWLASMGGLLGLGLANEGVQLLKVLLPADTPGLTAVTLDWRVALFAMGACLCCALIAGLPPAWQEVRGSLAGRMKQGSAGSVGVGAQKLRAGLVVAQVALSMTLLAGAGLLAHSLLRLQRVPLGFETGQIISMTSAFAWDSPGTKIKAFSAGVLERVAAIPGVKEAGVVDRLPLRGGSQSAPVAVRGRELAPELTRAAASWRTASAGYFRALAVPVLQGSLFPDRVDEKSPKVVLVDDRFARRYFPGESPVGKLIKLSPRSGPVEDKDWFRVVGVVGGVRASLRELNPLPEVYQPWGQAHWPLMGFVVRSQSGDPLLLANSIRKTAADVDPNQPIDDLQSLNSVVAASSASSRVQAGLLAGFASIALLLAAIGLYGLLSGEVARRTPEFGVRLALGAEPSRLLRGALGSGLRLVAAGLVVGIAGAVGAGRFLSSLLFEVSPADVLSMTGAAAVLALVALAACWIPARRASRVDPMVALRHD
ncbi:MAG: ABC transporter permease [Bryobacteraceae bacterium]|nr:ABC transporter permease [Bryobacteraceae bacterium]